MKPLALCAVVWVALAGCGDNIHTGEDCSLPGDEDGNGVADCDDPACATAPECRVACGNGKLEAGEACDDGNQVNGDGCDKNCTKTACGNGVLTMNEGCDDGNNVDGDGCDSNCVKSGCGNGVLTAGEACDDGNTVSGDGCDNNCTVTACGNGVMTMGEGCDDGNLADGDGCDSNCTLTACGNGILTAGEACDDGNTTNGDGCDDNCTVTACGNSVVTTGEACDDGNAVNGDGCDNNCTVTACGNGVVSPGEGCDDGNTINGDGCDNNCTLTACGNGILTTGEVCDDGNAVNGDGCDNNCTVTACGNGVVSPGEGCDDGNAVNGDGCDNNCTPTGCGNGILTTGEQCDDGNAIPGDGCSATCQLELTMEVEPNNTTAEATTNPVQITGDTTIRGAITPVADPDFFRVTVTTPTVIRFETLTSLYDCNTTIDLALLDAAGATIINDGTGSGIGQCGAIVVFLDAGTYFIKVVERGSNAIIGTYLLQVAYQTARGAEAEPVGVKGVNDTTATADGSLLAGKDVYVFGDHTNTTDVDVYAITVPPLGRIRAEVIEGDRATESCEMFGIDSRLRLFSDTGAVLVDDNANRGRGLCSLIDGSGTVPLDANARNPTTSPQTYYLAVSAATAAGGGGLVFKYRLQVTIR